MFRMHREVERLFGFNPGDAKWQRAAFSLLPGGAPPGRGCASALTSINGGFHHRRIAHSTGLKQSAFQLLQAALHDSRAYEATLRLVGTRLRHTPHFS